MGTSYFAADGSYGDAAGIVVIDTTTWDEEDWDTITFAPDSERARIAYELSVRNPDQLELPLEI